MRTPPASHHPGTSRPMKLRHRVGNRRPRQERERYLRMEREPT
jgi:hypothetical protein